MIMVTDYKPVVAIFKKDVAMSSQKLQRILLCIHQYNMQILYTLGLQLFKADNFVRHNCDEGKEEEILGIKLNISLP